MIFNIKENGNYWTSSFFSMESPSYYWSLGREKDGKEEWVIYFRGEEFGTWTDSRYAEAS